MKPRCLALGFLYCAAFTDSAGAQESSYVDRLRALEAATTELIERAKPAFVFIGGGSGFSISPDGYVLTNEHVVKEYLVGGRRPIPVYFTGGKMYTARVVGRDPQGDVALLKLENADGVPHLELGDSSKLRIGERVVALGDPFLLASDNLFLERVPPNFEPSASMGVISALNRYSDTYSDAIQVDLAVNRGNSGGPLIDLDGRVVGMNGKIETRFALGINTGVGYAIPSNQIQRFLGPLKQAGGGRVRHGTILGLEIADRANDKIGLPVVEVERGSPAEQVGFREGDLLLLLGGHRVRTRSRYHGILSTYPAGEEIAANVARGPKTLELRAVLVAPGRAFLGVTTVAADGAVQGARVTSVRPRTPADRAGIESGDIIVGLGGEPISSPTDLAGVIRSKAPGDVVEVEVVREEETVRVELTIGSRSD